MQRSGILVSHATISVLFLFYYLGAKRAFLERQDVGICSSNELEVKSLQGKGQLGAPATSNQLVHPSRRNGTTTRPPHQTS
jgi:hypothetical protein